MKRLGGRSLAEQCVNTALLSDLPAIYAATDSERIADSLIAEFGNLKRFNICLRPPVSNTQSSEEGVQTVLDTIHAEPPIEHVMLLQATSPGLQVSDINTALMIYNGRDTVLTVWEFPGLLGEAVWKSTELHFSPIYPKTMGSPPEPRLRQERPMLLAEAGSLYLAPVTAWRAGNRMVGHPRGLRISRWRAVEIDDPIDLKTWRRCLDLWRGSYP